ncbi:MAG: histidine kinase, partial [Flavobacterium sp.]
MRLKISFYFPLSLWVIVTCMVTSCQKTKSFSEQKLLQDSVGYYIEQAHIINYEELKDLKPLLNAERLLAECEKDSLYFTQNFLLSFVYYNCGKYEEFRHINLKMVHEASSINDTLNVARATAYLGEYFYFKNIPDSAIIYFQKAEKLFLEMNQFSSAAKTNIFIAQTKSNALDISGSDKSLLRAKNFINNEPNKKIEWLLYITLGLNSSRIKDYNKAEEHFLKAVKIAEDFDLSGMQIQSRAISYCNLAGVYVEQNKPNLAEKYINLGLNEPNLRVDYPQVYGSLHLNRGQLALVNKEYDAVFNDYRVANTLYDEVGTTIPNKVNINIQFSQYYNAKQQHDSAFYYIFKALGIAEDNNNLPLQLESIDYIRKMIPERELEYTKRYITLNDSLITLERKNAEKFARIEFEADELEREKGELLQKNKTLWRWGSTSAVFLGLGFVIYYQRNRHRHLKNKQKQEELNLSVYRLMLSRQEELERVRQEEKNRIAEELHDNIMNKMAAVRFNLTPLEYEPEPETIRKTLPYVHSIQDIEKEIRKLSHDLHREVFESQQDYWGLLEQLCHEYQNQQVSLFVEINQEVRWGRFSADQ